MTTAGACCCVGLRGGAVTHHINADVEVEREFLMDELNETLRLSGLILP